MIRPAEEIDPQLSFSVHVEGVLAENCWVAFSFTVTEEGDTVTAIRGELSADRNGRKATNRRRKGRSIRPSVRV